MQTQPPSVTALLTAQIEEAIRLGPLHTLTWAARTSPRRWFQLTVHGGRQHYLMLQVLLPTHLSRDRFDNLFRQYSWRNIQADGSLCLVYYLGRFESSEQLYAQAGRMAEQCAGAMRLLWDATEPDHIVLLSLCGPYRTLRPAREPLLLTP